MQQVGKENDSFFVALKDRSVLTACVYGQDRSPNAAKILGGEYLEGGLDGIDRLLQEADSPTERRKQRQSYENLMNRLRKSNVLILVTPKEEKKYQVPINLIEQNCPHAYILYGQSVTAIQSLLERHTIREDE